MSGPATGLDQRGRDLAVFVDRLAAPVGPVPRPRRRAQITEQAACRACSRRGCAGSPVAEHAGAAAAPRRPDGRRRTPRWSRPCEEAWSWLRTRSTPELADALGVLVRTACGCCSPRTGPAARALRDAAPGARRRPHARPAPVAVHRPSCAGCGSLLATSTPGVGPGPGRSCPPRTRCPPRGIDRVADLCRPSTLDGRTPRQARAGARLLARPRRRAPGRGHLGRPACVDRPLAALNSSAHAAWLAPGSRAPGARHRTGPSSSSCRASPRRPARRPRTLRRHRRPSPTRARSRRTRCGSSCGTTCTSCPRAGAAATYFRLAGAARGPAGAGRIRVGGAVPPSMPDVSAPSSSPGAGRTRQAEIAAGCCRAAGLPRPRAARSELAELAEALQRGRRGGALGQRAAPRRAVPAPGLAGLGARPAGRRAGRRRAIARLRANGDAGRGRGRAGPMADGWPAAVPARRDRAGARAGGDALREQTRTPTPPRWRRWTPPVASRATSSSARTLLHRLGEQSPPSCRRAWAHASEARRRVRAALLRPVDALLAELPPADRATCCSSSARPSWPSTAAAHRGRAADARGGRRGVASAAGTRCSRCSTGCRRGSSGQRRASGPAGRPPDRSAGRADGSMTPGRGRRDPGPERDPRRRLSLRPVRPSGSRPRSAAAARTGRRRRVPGVPSRRRPTGRSGTASSAPARGRRGAAGRAAVDDHAASSSGYVGGRRS